MAQRAAPMTVIALALLAGGATAAAQELRPGTLDLRTLDSQDYGRIEDDPSLLRTPPASEEDATTREEVAPDEEEEALPFDLFEGPQTPVSRRENPEGGAAVPAGQYAAPSGTPGEGRPTEPAAAPAAAPFATLGPVRSPTFAAVPVEGRVDPASAALRASLPVRGDDPFAAQGVRLGRLLLLPSIEQEVGYSDNLGADRTEVSGAFTETRASARLLSDWSRHALEINAMAGYRRNFSGEAREEPRIGLDGQLRLDIAQDWSGTLRGALSYAREDAILAEPGLPASERPDILAYSGGAELRRDIGPLTLSVAGDLVREERDSAPSGESRDFTTATLGLRAGYEIAPSLRPFLAASLGQRVFDSDNGGDSLIHALRAGVAFDFTEKLTGEAALGYAWNAPEDGALETLSSPTVDMSLAWSPRRGTDVVLSASTYFDPDESNLTTSTVYETALALRHRATARTEFNGRIGAAFRQGDGPGARDDVTYAAEAGVTHWLNRALALTALARHERFEGDGRDADYTANSLRMGMRWQR
ncbi:outer membrane beta-barrel protein [Aureimonas populi]|uniref:Outer membrane beta-barrel protein n=1 Tax=Aureimonas populi TaxID=1701758 RepID=A0ABW5CG25_9HYPH